MPMELNDAPSSTREPDVIDGILVVNVILSNLGAVNDNKLRLLEFLTVPEF